jgi:hypothetical protein
VKQHYLFKYGKPGHSSSFMINHLISGPNRSALKFNGILAAEPAGKKGGYWLT